MLVVGLNRSPDHQQESPHWPESVQNNAAEEAFGHWIQAGIAPTKWRRGALLSVRTMARVVAVLLVGEIQQGPL
jgi:hypothetical protein